MIRTCLILLATSFIFSSCEEELDEQQPFVKVYGEELQSSGEKIRELPNGDLLIVGATAPSIFEPDINNLGPSPVQVNEARAASITRIDRSGNVLLTRVFPLDSIEFNFFWESPGRAPKYIIRYTAAVNRGFYCVGMFPAVCISSGVHRFFKPFLYDPGRGNEYREFQDTR